MTNRFCMKPGLAVLVSALLVLPLALASTMPVPKDAKTLPLDVPAQLSRLSAKGALVGVTTVDNRVVAVGERGHILMSQDGGTQWTQAATPVSVTLTAVRFADAKTGWAVGHGAVVLHTRDGGQHWSRQSDGRALMGSIAKARQVAQEKGDTLLAEKLQRFIDDGPDKPLLDALFLDARRGFAVGAYGLVIRTEDGGANWQVASNVIESEEDRHIYAIRQVGSAIFLAGEQGLLYRSSDAGQSFVKLKSPAEGTWFDLVGSGRELLLLGLRGALWHSVDGGDNWRRLTVDTKYSFVSGVSLGQGKGYVLADEGGGLWHWVESAASPRRLPQSARFPLSSLAVSSDGSLVATGLLGVLRTSSPTP